MGSEMEAKLQELEARLAALESSPAGADEGMLPGRKTGGDVQIIKKDLDQLKYDVGEIKDLLGRWMESKDEELQVLREELEDGKEKKDRKDRKHKKDKKAKKDGKNAKNEDEDEDEDNQPLVAQPPAQVSSNDVGAQVLKANAGSALPSAAKSGLLTSLPTRLAPARATLASSKASRASPKPAPPAPPPPSAAPAVKKPFPMLPSVGTWLAPSRATLTSAKGKPAPAPIAEPITALASPEEFGGSDALEEATGDFPEAARNEEFAGSAEASALLAPPAPSVPAVKKLTELPTLLGPPGTSLTMLPRLLSAPRTTPTPALPAPPVPKKSAPPSAAPAVKKPFAMLPSVGTWWAPSPAILTGATGKPAPAPIAEPITALASPEAARQDEPYADPASKKYAYEVLKVKVGSRRPTDVDPARRELYLSESNFQAVFGMSPEAFSKLPKWKQQIAKKAEDLF